MRAVDECEVVLELDLWYIRERVWDPGWGSSRQPGRITSTKTSSQGGHDHRSEGETHLFPSRTRITLPSMFTRTSRPSH